MLGIAAKKEERGGRGKPKSGVADLQHKPKA